MLFNSVAFLIFFPAVFCLYWMLPGKRIAPRNLLLLSASYFFYGSWDWRFLTLLFLSSSVDFLVGLWLEKSQGQPQRKRIILLSVILNLAFLGFFKYFNFFADTFADLLNVFGFAVDHVTLEIVLPVGISFYTFQSLSYTLDVYYGRLNASRNYLAFITYVAFFPQLVAGPIERAGHLLPQFLSRRNFNYAVAASGLRLILWGLFKKIAVADRVAVYADSVFDNPELYGGFAAIFGTFCFAVQIYCDFSGYSDIAVGSARLLGFDLMKNFRRPYFSTSLKEFWSRWHISLSTWFRDYLYVPLGGNRKGKARWTVNIFLTFLISGLWHGANWTFVVWGGLHGAGYLAEVGIKKLLRIRLPGIVSGLLVFCLVCMAWIFFRAENLKEAINILHECAEGLLHPGEWAAAIHAVAPQQRLLLFVMASILILVAGEIFLSDNERGSKYFVLPAFVRWSLYYLLIVWILVAGEFGNPHSFIYFQF